MSDEQIVSGGGLTRLEIGRAEGELEVLGWDEAHIRIVGLDDDEVIPPMDDGGVLRLARLREDVTISLPRAASLHVLSAKEDVSVRGLQGTVRLDSVSGDVKVQDVGGILLGAINGDTQLERCQGDVRVDYISGDVVAHSLGGLEITSGIKGDIEVQDVAGEVSFKSMHNGDARISRVGRITVSTMHGDCGIAQVGSVEIGNLSGDLSVQEVESVCQISNMHGDAHLRSCGGVVMVDNLGGDLIAQDLRGGIGVGNITGDVQLDTPLTKGSTYTVHASAGDIALRIRGEINARFVAQTLGGSISTRLPLTVERGRRRHLVGAIGRAEATVTLQSDKGDISISAADRTQEKTMSDDFGDDFGYREEAGAGSSFGGEVHFGRGFGVHWDKGPGRFSFMTGYGHDDPDGPGDPRMQRDRGKGKWPFDWDDRQRADYERRIREMSERTANAARKAAERATEYAERAARRARETDWESVGRDVRSAIERAMGEMEHLLEQFRSGPGAPTPPRPPHGPPPPPPPPPPGFHAQHAQRVPIERDEEPSGRSKDELDAARRTILEQLRSGAISMDEAERQLDALR